MRAALLKSLEPVVEAAGFELVELEFAQGKGGGILRLFIDKPGGVSVDDCADISRAVSETLESQDSIPGRYTLEVSSPGFDRVLRKKAHFERFIGELVFVELKLPQDGRRRWSGRLASLAGEAIMLTVDGKDYSLPLSHIQTARLRPV
jgi:ribosome maturation factor RimP